MGFQLQQKLTTLNDRERQFTASVYIFLSGRYNFILSMFLTTIPTLVDHDFSTLLVQMYVFVPQILRE